MNYKFFPSVFSIGLLGLVGLLALLAAPGFALSMGASFNLPYAPYATYGEKFVSCIEIIDADCSIATKSYRYNYTWTDFSGNLTYVAGNLIAWNDSTLFGGLGIPVSKPGFWCASVTANRTGTLNLTAACNNKDTGAPQLFYNAVVLAVGNVSIALDTSSLLFTKFTGENITVRPFDGLVQLNLSNYTINGTINITALSPPQTLSQYTINYTIRNATNGEVAVLPVNQPVLKPENAPWLLTYAIPQSTPIGIIDLTALGPGGAAGGRYILYKAAPVRANLLANGATFTTASLGGQVQLRLNVTNQYGNITAITTTITIPPPNGTSVVLNLSADNNFTANYTLPSLNGTFIATSVITHSTGTVQSFSATIIVQPFTLDVSGVTSGVSIYRPGDQINVRAGIVDTSNSSRFINSSANATIIPISGQQTTYSSLFPIEGNYHKFSHALPLDAPNGTYSLRVDARDENNASYSRTLTFTVERPRNINVTPSNVLVNLNTTSVSTIQINVSNIGSVPITSINGSVSGNVSSFISFSNVTAVVPLNATNKTSVSLLILPLPSLTDGFYTGSALVQAGSDVATVSITANVSLSAFLISFVPVLDVGTNYSVQVLTTDPLVELPVRNAGNSTLLNITYQTVEDAESIINRTDGPNNLSAGSEGKWRLIFNQMTTGKKFVRVEIAANGVQTKNVSVNVTAYVDAKPLISELSTRTSALAERVAALRLKGVQAENITALDARVAALRNNVSNANGKYISARYEEVVFLLPQISALADSIESSLRSLEATQTPTQQASFCGDGTCGANETPTSCSKDCASATPKNLPTPASRSTNIILIVAIILGGVVAAVVVFLSLVPEEYPGGIELGVPKKPAR